MIDVTRTDDVTVVELRRPERRNALDAATCDALREAALAADADGTRALVVTGAGTSFCAGADLDGVYGETFIAALYGMLGTLTELRIPVVAAVNGPAIGAGTQLALACDLRVAAPTARFGVPTARNGMAVDAWTIRTLAAVAGTGTARAMMLGAEMLDADTAYVRGLVDRIGDLDAALAWATEIAGFAPLTLAYNKLVLNSRPADADADAGARIAAGWDACWSSEDVREASIARTEKRPPVFVGR
ncbi:enoyl-CoA hydratase [Mumia flava]|uniref:Enoyl-CoA hydratase n=1 Tax=Mumia flava TaxID=1348852 RepID=A0A0B2BGJ7_9ACTN|nr:enoyl-CoA hydratase [Mumia flava]PJJ56302.1 enoyl-CoA hydratase [Mumia flava]